MQPSELAHNTPYISPIVRYPSKGLRNPVRHLSKAAIGSHSLSTQAASMLDVCTKERGLGLAAQQVGLDVSLAVIPLYSGGEKPILVVVANLEITERGPDELGEEGCLSLYSVFAQVTAPSWVRAKGIDALSGEPFDEVIHGYAARAVSHEVDHLAGKLLIDRIKSPWRKIFARQVDKARSRYMLESIQNRR